MLLLVVSKCLPVTSIKCDEIKKIVNKVKYNKSLYILSTVFLFCVYFFSFLKFRFWIFFKNFDKFLEKKKIQT